MIVKRTCTESCFQEYEDSLKLNKLQFFLGCWNNVYFSFMQGILNIYIYIVKSVKVFHGRSLILNENDVYSQANPSSCGHPSALCWWHSWAFPSTLCTSHPRAAEPIFVFRFRFFSFLHAFRSTVGEFVTPSSQAGGSPSSTPILALGVSKAPLIFLRWAILPKKGEKQQNIFMFDLAGFEFRKMFTTWRFFSPKDANLRHGRCRAGGSWRGPSLAPCLGWCSAGLAPALGGVSLSTGAHSPNPFRKEHLAWTAGLLRVIPSPEPPSTLLLGLSMSHNSIGKTQWADKIQFKYSNTSFGGNLFYGKGKNAQSGACSASLIGPKITQLVFTGSCLPLPLSSCFFLFQVFVMKFKRELPFLFLLWFFLWVVFCWAFCPWQGGLSVLVCLGFVAETLRSLMESEVLFFHEVGSNIFL